MDQNLNILRSTFNGYFLLFVFCLVTFTFLFSFSFLMNSLISFLSLSESGGLSIMKSPTGGDVIGKVACVVYPEVRLKDTIRKISSLLEKVGFFQT